MRIAKTALLLALLALLLAGCRFAAVETDSLRVETPTAAPRAEQKEARTVTEN